MNPPPTPTLAIIAGGQSSRLGRDKAALVSGATTLLARLVDLGTGLGLPVMIIGREGCAERPAVPCHPDREAGLGPLGGIATALAHAPLIIAVACDLPLLDDAALGWLVQAVRVTPLRDGLATVHAGGLEPLFSCYAARVAPRINEHLRRGERALHRLIEAGDFFRLEAPAWLIPKLANVNTPEDWRKLGGGDGSGRSRE